MQPVRALKRNYEEIRKLYQDATAFDWDMKDIVNLKTTPEQLFTPIVFWFWINS